MKVDFKYLCFFGVFVFAMYFLFTLNRVYEQQKEINCITYYTSLGYISRGCDKYVNDFINTEGD